MKVAIQLYSVRQSMEKDPVATIKKVAQAGYRNLEVANHNSEVDNGVGFGVAADEMKALLKECDATVVSAHIYPLVAEKIAPVLEYHNKIGTKYIAMPMDFYRDKEEVLRKAESLNKVGEVCKKAGIQLVYHNHFHEFQHFGKETIFDIMMNNTDPDLLKVELDTYWTMRAGKNPVEVLKTLGERVCLIHQKDYAKGFEDEINLLTAVEANNDYVDMDRFLRDLNNDTFTEIGTGIMDIQSIINAGNNDCKADYIVLEQDYTKLDELESIKVSMEQFKQFTGIEW